MKATCNLVNGVERSERYSTFDIPSFKERAGLRVGDHAKICVEFESDDEHGRGGERFWVEVVAIRSNGYDGRVANMLLFTDEHGLDLNDRIRFNPKHVLDVSRREEVKP